MNPLRIPSRRLDIPWIRRSAAEHDTVELLLKLRCLLILTYVAARDKGNSLFLHHRKLTVNALFLKLHIGDSVPQKPAGFVFPLEYGHAVPSSVQHIRSRKSGRSGTDHRYLLPGTYLHRTRRRITLFVCILNDSIFICLRSDCIPVQITGTCRLTKRRAHP